MAVFCSLDVSDSLIFHGLQHTRLPSLVTQMVKEPPAMKVFDPRGRKIPWRRARQPTSVFLHGESHGQRSLAGYSPWGRKESDTTELVTHTQTHTQTHTHTHRHTHTHTHTHTHRRMASQVELVLKNLPANAGNIRDMGLILGLERSPGEGNGNPVQDSSLENPMDRGTWQATVYRVAQSQI